MCKSKKQIIEKYKDKGIHIPERKTKYAAGYDVEAAEDVLISPFQLGCMPTLIPTGLKAYCQDNEFYILVNRSSGPKKGLVMANGIGIIDKDYYNNESNEGHIYFQYYNMSCEPLLIHKGDVIGQVVFLNYLLCDGDSAHGIRRGGFGTTDK